jgi:hypothetical protein
VCHPPTLDSRGIVRCRFAINIAGTDALGAGTGPWNAVHMACATAASRREHQLTPVADPCLPECLLP